MGPAVESAEKVKELIDAGMNMARLNLSHGGYEEHQSRLDRVREAAKAAGKPIAILVDLQGPKIRLARFANGPHELERGDIFTITTDEVGFRIPVIAKIEKPQAVDNLEEIVAAFDGIMVARGDLGVEMPIEEVPLVQKRCIELAREAAKPVIVATQMLDSMITNSSPTRAEATDCANAVLDGADALMLSGETSVGAFAIEAVATMARIIARTEEGGFEMIRALRTTPKTKGGAITRAAAEVGAIVGAKYLVTFTQSGDSARRMARLRSPIPIVAFTPEVGTYNRLALSWGVEPEVTPMVKHTDEMVKQADTLLIESGRAHVGENVVIVAGSPPGIPGSTNAMRVHVVGDAVGGVVAAYR